MIIDQNSADGNLIWRYKNFFRTTCRKSIL